MCKLIRFEEVLNMKELRQQIDVTLEQLNQYPHQGDFDLYDFEELVFQEFQEIQKRTLSILTNKKLKSKKNQKVALAVVKS